VGVLSRLESIVAEMTSKLDALSERGVRSWVEELAVLHALQLQAQALLGMLLRMAAGLGYAPESPGEAARILREEGIIGGDEYLFIRRVIGFRNVVVHAYTEVNMELVRGILEEREYRRLAVLAARLLGEASKRGLDP